MLTLITHFICRILKDNCLMSSHFHEILSVRQDKDLTSFAKFLTHFLIKLTTSRKNLTSVWFLDASQTTIFSILSFRIWTNSSMMWVIFKALINLLNNLSFLNESFSFAYSILDRKWCLRNEYCFLKFLNLSKKSFM